MYISTVAASAVSHLVASDRAMASVRKNQLDRRVAGLH